MRFSRRPSAGLPAARQRETLQEITDNSPTTKAQNATARDQNPVSTFSSSLKLPALARGYLGLLGALVVMTVLFGVLSEHFLTLRTFSTIANQMPDLLVMAVGMTFVLIIGGIDLSVGSVLALAGSTVSVAVVKWGWPPVPAALLGVLAAAAC
jgi:ABC-type xylose transport system permease subunit